MRRMHAPVIAAVLSACGASSPGDGTTRDDASVGADSAVSDTDAAVTEPPPIEIGTGDRGFVPVSEGSVVGITLGTQGTGRFDSYHLEGAFRARGLGASDVMVDYQILLLPDRRSIARFRRRYPMLQPITGGGFGAWGMIAQLEDCCLARDADLVMSMEVTGAGGQSLKAELQIRGGSSCPDVTGIEICP